MSGRYLVTVSEGWDKEQDKTQWCVEAYAEEDEETSLGYAYSTHSISDAAYDLFNAIERG